MSIDLGGMPTGPAPSLMTTGLVVCSAIFPVLSALCILLRWKSRTMVANGWKADDWWIIGTWVATLGVSINAWVFSSLAGIDHYKVDMITGSQRSAMSLFVGTLFLQPSLAAVKISILLFYKRVFPTPMFAKCSWAAMTAITIWCIVFEVLVVFQGDPIPTSWNGKGKFRFDIVAFGLAQAGTSLVLDVCILLFPIPILWNLQLHTRRKFAVAAIFWLGGFCCVAAIVRLILLHQVLSTTVNSVEEGYNLLYIQSKAYIFTIVEPNCSIIAACLPCYGTLLRSLGGRNLESIVASVRSALSLGSRGSSNHSGGRSRGGEVRLESPKGMKANASKTNSTKATNDSEIELTELERGNHEEGSHYAT